MKILKIILIGALILLIIFSISVYIFLQHFDVNYVKDKITEYVSEVLDRDFEIENIEYQFRIPQGLSLAIKGISISESLTLSPHNFLEIEQINLDINLNAYLSSGEIVIRDIEVLTPKINLIRNESGKWNFEDLKKSNQNDSSAPTEESTKPKASSSKKVKVNKKEIKNLFIQSIKLTEGKIKLVDEKSNPALEFNVSDINAYLKDFSFVKPFRFSIEGYIVDDTNLQSINGTAKLNINQKTVDLKDTRLKLSISNELIHTFSQYVPKNIEIKQAGDSNFADLNLYLAQGLITQNEPQNIVANGKLSFNSLRLKELLVPLTQGLVNFQVQNNTLRVDEYSFLLGKGKVLGKATIEDYLKSQNTTFSLKIDNLRVHETIPQREFPVKVQGDLNSRVDITSNGLAFDDLKNSLSGKADFEIKDGKLVDINILKMFLERIALIPNLTQRIEENLSDKYKKVLKNRNTELKQFATTTEIDRGTFDFRSVVEADAFIVKAHGSYNLNDILYLEGDFTIPQELSLNITDAVTELRMVLNDDEEIYIPLTPYEGSFKNLKVMPDLEYLSTRVIMNRGKEELDKILDRYFGKGEEEKPKEGEEPSDIEDVPPERILIEGILDSIFQ